MALDHSFFILPKENPEQVGAISTTFKPLINRLRNALVADRRNSLGRAGDTRERTLRQVKDATGDEWAGIVAGHDY